MAPQREARVEFRERKLLNFVFRTVGGCCPDKENRGTKKKHNFYSTFYCKLFRSKHVCCEQIPGQNVHPWYFLHILLPWPEGWNLPETLTYHVGTQTRPRLPVSVALPCQAKKIMENSGAELPT